MGVGSGHVRYQEVLTDIASIPESHGAMAARGTGAFAGLVGWQDINDHQCCWLSAMWSCMKCGNGLR